MSCPMQVLERLNTHVAEAFGESRSSSWAEGASSLDVLALAADVGAFAAMARDEWGQRMSSVLGAQSARAGELVKG